MWNASKVVALALVLATLVGLAVYQPAILDRVVGAVERVVAVVFNGNG